MKSLSVGVSPKAALLALLAGLLSAASFPPLGLWPLAVVAVILFLRLCRDVPPREAFNLAMVYGLAFGSGTMYWFFNLFGYLTPGLIGVFALYFGLLAVAVALTRGYPVLVRATLVGMFAIAIEWLRGDAWYLRFPWYTVPHALASEPRAIAPVRWLGTYGFSGFVWFVAAWGVFGRPWAWTGFLLIPVCALLVPAGEPPDQRALLLQSEAGELYDLFLIPRVTEENLDLAVLPELAYGDDYSTVLKSRLGPTALARKLQAPVVFGATDGGLGAPGFQNLAAVINGDGTLIGTFPKQHPVPLFADGRPGDRRPIFPVKGGSLGVAVCYDFDAPDVASSLVAQGATVLVVPTSDSMHWSIIEHVHHELLVRLRAVENDRWVVRAVSSGRSEAISPRGVPSAEGVEIGEMGTVVVGYRHQDTRPLGSRMYLLGPTAAVGTLLFLGFVTVSSWRRGSRAGDPLPTGEPENESDATSPPSTPER